MNIVSSGSLQVILFKNNIFLNKAALKIDNNLVCILNLEKHTQLFFVLCFVVVFWLLLLKTLKVRSIFLRDIILYKNMEVWEFSLFAKYRVRSNYVLTHIFSTYIIENFSKFKDLSGFWFFVVLLHFTICLFDNILKIFSI